MQGDLISRGALIHYLDNQIVKCNDFEECSTLRSILSVVEEQPTAYSAEDVVAEIGLLDFKTHRVMRETGINSEVFETVRVDKYVRLDEVLAIVRNSGKE